MMKQLLAAAVMVVMGGVAAGQTAPADGLTTGEERAWFENNYGRLVREAERGSADDREVLYQVLMEGPDKADAPAGGKRLARLQAFKVACDGKMGEDKIRIVGEKALDDLWTLYISGRDAVGGPGDKSLAALRGQLAVIENARGAGVAAQGRFSDESLARAYMMLGQHLYWAGTLGEGLEAVKKAEALARKADPTARTRPGEALDLRKQIEEELAIDETLVKDPKNDGANLKKGTRLLARGADGQAVGYFEKSGIKEWERLGAALKGSRDSAPERLAVAEALSDCLPSAEEAFRRLLIHRLLMELESIRALPKVEGEIRARAEFLKVKAARLLEARVVFVIDHSGSMLDSFGLLREKVLESVGKMGSEQRFRVVMFSETVDATYPRKDDWAPVTQETKRDLAVLLDPKKVAGGNDDTMAPQVNAFKSALAVKPPPQVVCFLTDGNFDPKLVGEIAKLNVDRKVKINTAAFVKIGREAEENLRKIASDNGGEYRFVSEKELEAK